MASDLEQKQLDLRDILASGEFFADIAVIAERDKRHKAEADAYLSGKQKKAGKAGAVVRVMMPSLALPHPNAPGPALTGIINVRIQELESLNQSGSGTGKEVEQIVIEAIKRIHCFGLSAGENFIVDQEAAEANAEFLPRLTYDLFVRCQLPQDQAAKVSLPTISQVGLTITLATTTPAASIYYTTDGSFPWSGNGTLYSAPWEVADGTRLRVAAYLAGSHGSDVAEQNIADPYMTDAGQSTVTSSPTSVTADGVEQSTVTVTLKDAAGDPVIGHTASLSASPSGNVTIGAASGTSDAGGVVTFIVSNDTVEDVTFTATDDTDSVEVTQTADVDFVAAPTTTKLLINFDGSNGSQAITDAKGNTVTVYDNAQISTAQTQAGFGQNGLFDGSGDYLEVDDSPDWDFETEDFTIAWWEYRTNGGAGRPAIARDALSAKPAFTLGWLSGSVLQMYITSNGSSWDIASALKLGDVLLNQWVHYAVTREGNTWRAFQNGVKESEWISALAPFAQSDPLSIGRALAGQYFGGRLDSLLIRKGQALYTAAFTPPASPYTS